MKNKIIYMLCIMALLAIGMVSSLTTITTCQELQDMDLNLAEDYILIDNVDCGDTVNWNDGAGFVPVGDVSNHFTGTLNGKSYDIIDLFINTSTDSIPTYAGLFGRVTDPTISNVNLVNVKITGRWKVGGIVGEGRVVIGNCSVTGTLNGVNAQGITDDWIGGIIGELRNGGKIDNCWTNVNITDIDSQYRAGGIVAFCSGSTINNTYSSGNIIGQISGGICSEGTTSIYNSYSNAVIVGSISGGIYGFPGFNTVENSFATGNIASGWTTAGGLFGATDLIETVTKINIYWNNHTLNPDWCYFFGDSGCNAIQDNEAYFYDITNEPMASWDFENVWCETENGFPALQWEGRCKIPPPTIFIRHNNKEILIPYTYFERKESDAWVIDLPKVLFRRFIKWIIG